jgi:hypothetical protein
LVGIVHDDEGRRQGECGVIASKMRLVLSQSAECVPCGTPSASDISPLVSAHEGAGYVES